MFDYILSKGLTEAQLKDIGNLSEICSKYEPLNMKLNWGMLETRSNEQVYDFLCYEDKMLVGFIGLYDITLKSKEIEITGMVHPDYRRKGIFKHLFSLAIKRCLDIKPERILLICEHSKVPGATFIISLGAEYSCSEYKMKFEQHAVPDTIKRGIHLRKADSSDYDALVDLDNKSFSTDDEDTSEVSADIYESTMVAEIKGEFVGKIGLAKENTEGYIFGFAVKPELRGRGYGREILGLALEKFIEDNLQTVILEVAVNNKKALNLYKDCGFKETTVYDYYELKGGHYEL